MDMVIQQFVTSVESFPYLAVPFFIMVGSVMNYSGISEELKNNLLAQTPAGRLGEPKDIAKAVAFLASEDASYINGTTLHVNGGMYMS